MKAELEFNVFPNQVVDRYEYGPGHFHVVVAHHRLVQLVCVQLAVDAEPHAHMAEQFDLCTRPVVHIDNAQSEIAQRVEIESDFDSGETILIIIIVVWRWHAVIAPSEPIVSAYAIAFLLEVVVAKVAVGQQAVSVVQSIRVVVLLAVVDLVLEIEVVACVHKAVLELIRHNVVLERTTVQFETQAWHW